ncbi:MAG: hypothetical protein H7A22_15305, partial [Spirochaetales bacterium]|nr:hypothetical protein [Spirochaetales bacterium]
MNITFARLRPLLWILAAAVLAVLYWNARAIDLDAHEKMDRALRAVRENDSSLKQNLLRSRYYLDRTYDPLNGSVDGIQSALSQIAHLLEANRLHTGPEFQDSFQKYSESFLRQKSAIDRFKSANSILRNSLQYLSLSAVRLDQASGYGSAGISGALLRDVLIYNVNDDAELARSIERRRGASVAPLIAGGGAVGREARIFDRHIENILTRKKEVDQLVSEVVLGGDAGLAEEMIAAYGADHVAQSYRAGIYNLLLFAFAGAVLLYVVLVILKLQISSW